MKGQEFELMEEMAIYKPTDIRQGFKERKAILIVGMEQFKLTELQQARFEVLVGCRYNKENNELKLTCELFPEYEQNKTKVH